MPTFPPQVQSLAARLLPIETHDVPDARHMRAAGVLLLLFPGRDGVSFFLTERPATLARHAGQISLPGGRWEEHDAALWDTALRETQEELGFDTSDVLELGRLEPVAVTVTEYLIWPFVGWLPYRPALNPDSGEVASVIEVPLRLLEDPSAVHEEEWEFRGSRYVVALYRFGDAVVWGATARVLSHLAARLGIPPEGTPLPGSVRLVQPPASPPP